MGNAPQTVALFMGDLAISGIEAMEIMVGSRQAPPQITDVIHQEGPSHVDVRAKVALAIGKLAIKGMDAIVDLWQAPQQVTDDIHQGEPSQANARESSLGVLESRDAGATVEEPLVELSVGDQIKAFSDACKV